MRPLVLKHALCQICTCCNCHGHRDSTGTGKLPRTTIPLARRQETGTARFCACAQQAAYIAMFRSPTALSLGNFNQSRTPAWAPNTLHVGSSTSQTLRREQLDESAQHILATSADFFKRFQSPAAIAATLAFTILAEPGELLRFNIVADSQRFEASISRRSSRRGLLPSLSTPMICSSR
jgi:hypothetical protein